MSNFRQLTALAAVLCLGMFVILARSAAPVPQRDSGAKRKFETLKKKLLPVVARWLKDEGAYGDRGGVEPEVRLARLIAPAKAKITFRFKVTLDGERLPEDDYFISVYLSYYDGHWTTTGNSDWHKYPYDLDKLMLAIDEIDTE